ncbi:hypothetical protein [Variovorax sp. RA8]|uniref:hypothetical protein n=1 Tax=Variovorax sp. (strain JCM 16519 / RA8) TaxID=662548 RepID=UPI0013181867|nr:hypothetical protein [Variovorax sp. RA8]VTU44845.1 hypothetical protein RA8P2_00285 [Variovorax sp. RA8]
MNNEVEKKFDYRGLIVTIELTGDGEQISAHADVHRDGEFAGRVALTASQAEREILFDKLNRKAKELVDRLLARDVSAAASPAAV